MSKYHISIPAQSYELVRLGNASQVYVIKDDSGNEVTHRVDLGEEDAETAAEGLLDKLLSDIVPDATGCSVGDLQSELETFFSEQGE